MSFEEFEDSLNHEEPPSSSIYLQALWWDGRGEWEKSHELIQDLTDASAAWIHAYLHRKEGDDGNARFWYLRAGKKFPSLSLSAEWKQLVEAYL